MDQSSEPPLTPQQAEAKFEQEVRDNLKRNYFATFMQGMLGMTGFRMMNAPTFLPAYLHMVSGSDAIVGVALALQQLGGVISPIFGATQIEHRKKIMPMANLFGGLMRTQILLITLAAFFLHGPLLVFALILFLFLMGLSTGPQQVAMQVLLGKVIPVAMRGRLQGIRNMTGGLIAAILSYVAGVYFVGDNWLGNGYATTFMFAFFLTTAGLVFLSVFTREPDPPIVRVRKPMSERIKDFPVLLATDVGFKNFLIAQSLATAARVAAPFFILYARHTITLDGKAIGLLSLAFLGADTVANMVWGTLGDRYGFRAVMRVGIVLGIASTGLLLVSNNFALIFLAFCGMGAALSGNMMSTQTMVLEFGSREDVPMRAALMATSQGAVAAIGPLVGGVVAGSLGYGALFAGTVTLQVAALYMYWRMVPEPRERRLTRERAAAEAAAIAAEQI